MNIRTIVADNLKALIEASAKGRRATSGRWARELRLDPKIIQRSEGPQGLTVRTVEQVAGAAGLEAWQLLVPNLNPAAPPELRQRFSPYANELAASLDKITDRVMLEAAYAMCARILDNAIEAQKPLI